MQVFDYSDCVYKDHYAPGPNNAVRYGSDLYNLIRGDLHFKDLELLAITHGASHMAVAYMTDEQLVYFIAEKLLLI